MPVSGSNVVAAADALQAMIEKVRPKLEELFERTNRLGKLIGKGPVETISDKLYRIPVLKGYGGTFQKFDADNGVLGYGSGMQVDKLTAGYIYTNYAVAMSTRSMDATATSGQSIVKVFAKQLAEAMGELAVYDDMTLHGNGDGRLTNSASATGTWGSSLTTYTFAAATDTLGVNRLREMMAVEVFDAAGGTPATTGTALNTIGEGSGSSKRANGSKAGYPAIIDHIDWDNKIVYLDSTITGASSTDILVFTDQSSNGTRKSSQSTWPLSGDTFRHGIYYANETNTSLYYLGIQRSALNQLNPANVSASSASWTHYHTLQIRDKLLQRRNEEDFMGMFGIVHMAQRAQAMTIGITISNWFRGAKDSMIDLMPSNIGYEDSFEFAGLTHYVSKRQYRDRVDYVNPKHWGRAQICDTDFYQTPDGTMFFPTRASTGQIKAGIEFFVKQGFDYVCYNPGSQGVIQGLAVPTGW